MFARYKSCSWISAYLIHLLKERDAAKKKDKAIKWIETKINEIPHISQIASNTLRENLLCLFPNETENIQHEKELEGCRGISTLFFHRFKHRLFHFLRTQEQYNLNFRSLTDENQYDYMCDVMDV